MNKILFAIVVSCFTSQVYADQRPLDELYVEDLGYPYTHTWSGRHIYTLREGVHNIFVGGEGKRASFFGVLSLDCNSAKYSRWEATGGPFSAENIPFEVIRAIQTTYC